MIWLEKCLNYIFGFACLLAGIVALIALSPLILVSFICLLTPVPFRMLVNLIFPIFYFMGENGARKFFDWLMSFIASLLRKAADFFRVANTVS